ncbi:hypothetical protein PVK06_013320 [Gossypium arboreum]|uniref:Retrotransposon gag domain-containing protein n=1 Tax=Gossypium arboreum TaxID=29729 RepID=A0ABR0QDY2_GOSAR|nr:hypothetical protein PVK06_013320 [Gossypium arboreum]
MKLNLGLNPNQTLENKNIGVDPSEEVSNARVNVNPNVAQQPMAQMIRQIAEVLADQHLLCIVYPTMDSHFELKLGLIKLLPTFSGLQNENPHKHLKEFHTICLSVKPQGVTEDQIKLLAFPFPLLDFARKWLFYLPPGSITTWVDLSRLFLNKFFPTSHVAKLK